MSPVGTFRTSRSCLVMSVHRGEAEIICSFRVFRILTHTGHWGSIWETSACGEFSIVPRPFSTQVSAISFRANAYLRRTMDPAPRERPKGTGRQIDNWRVVDVRIPTCVRSAQRAPMQVAGEDS